MSEAITELKNQLRAMGWRLTRQRRLILQILQEANGHLDANAILERAQAHDPRIGLSTVYRTLQLLADMGLAEQRFIGRDHTRKVYERAGSGEHYHFTCLTCGQIIEFRSPLVGRARREVAAELGVTILRACVCFEGYCSICTRGQQHLSLKGRETR
jgi:Fur family ferric uptake transcriptional regulator